MFYLKAGNVLILPTSKLNNTKAANAQMIGESETYSGDSAVENGIAPVKNNGSDAAAVTDNT